MGYLTSDMVLGFSVRVNRIRHEFELCECFLVWSVIISNRSRIDVLLTVETL